MKIETYQEMCAENGYDHLKGFIKNLLAEGVSLSLIDVNDWECNLCPSVYVHNRHKLFNIRRYQRCSAYDVQLAVKFIGGK